MALSEKEILWLNQNIRFIDLFDEDGVEVNRSGRVFCPFHHNVNTQAARLYEHNNEIYCWSCTRTYKVYNYLKDIRTMSEKQMKELIDEDADLESLEEPDRKILVPVEGRKWRQAKKDDMSWNEFLRITYSIWRRREDDDIKCVDLNENRNSNNRRNI